MDPFQEPSDGVLHHLVAVSIGPSAGPGYFLSACVAIAVYAADPFYNGNIRRLHIWLSTTDGQVAEPGG